MPNSIFIFSYKSKFLNLWLRDIDIKKIAFTRPAVKATINFTTKH